VTTATTCVNNAGCPAGEVCVQHYQGPASAFELELEDNDFWCFGNGATIPDVGNCSVTVATTCTQDSNCPGGETCVNPGTTFGAAATDAGKSHFAYATFTNAALENLYSSCATPLPLRTLNRGAAGGTDPDPIVEIDPRPAPGSILVQPAGEPNRTPPNDGFFTPAPYNGAFESGSFWMGGWTTAERTGLLAKCGASSPLSVPGQVNQDANFTTASRLDWSGPATAPPFAYDMLRKTGSVLTPGAANIDFSTGSCMVTDQVGKKFGDDAAVPALGQVFFYAVRAGNACGEGTLGYYRNPGQANDGTDRPAATCP
jgi:hypothetical protein